MTSKFILNEVQEPFELEASKSDLEKPGTLAFNSALFIGPKLPVVKASRNTWMNIDNGKYEFIITKDGSSFIMDIFDANVEDKDLGFVNSLVRGSLEEAQATAHEYLKTN